MITLTAEQSARYYRWLSDATTTHPAFAHTVDLKILPQKLTDLNETSQFDEWLATLENALRAMRVA